jgi:hypothetical protein
MVPADGLTKKKEEYFFLSDLSTRARAPGCVKYPILLYENNNNMMACKVKENAIIDTGLS